MNMNTKRDSQEASGLLFQSEKTSSKVCIQQCMRLYVREKIKAGLCNQFQIKPDFPSLLRRDDKYSRLLTTVRKYNP